MNDASYQSTDRRPIAARRWRIWQELTRWLAQHHVSPNGISIAGMVCGTLAGIVFALTPYFSEGVSLLWVSGAVLIQLRLLANLLDGMVAIESGQASAIGELFNEVPDRLSDTAILIGVGYSVGCNPLLGYAAACAALFTAYIRTMGKAGGASQHYCGPMAKQQRMALLILLALYCGLAPARWQPTWGEGYGLPSIVLSVIIVGCVLTSIRRLGRIASDLKRGRA